MSLKHLTPDERATYLLGLAVRRQLEEGPRDPDTLREIAPVCRWMEQWLNEWELLLIAQGTGDYFGDEGDNGPVFVETTPIRRAPLPVRIPTTSASTQRYLFRPEVTKGLAVRIRRSENTVIGRLAPRSCKPRRRTATKR